LYTLIKACIPTLISRYTDQKIYNNQARDCVFTVIDDCETIVYFS
jgi:hypothetical protein